MRLLVTGAAGMLGRDVVAAATDAGHEVSALARADLDIADAAAVRSAVTGAEPDAVVNCAAWTEHGIPVLHVSSDYVFDGRSQEPYREDAPTAPQGAYGRSKLAGERAVEAAGGRSAIVRSAWVFGPHGRNFVDTMRRLGAERDELAVVDDQIGCPTYTGHLAPALLRIAESGATGYIHMAGGGNCSWFDLAVATFEETGLECHVRPQSTADLGRPAPRPAFSVLTSTRADVPVLPHWREGLRAHLNRVEVAA